MSKYNKFIEPYVSGFLGLFYPQFCVACGINLLKQELEICTKCLYELPKTNFHKVKANPIEKVFYGRVYLERATAFYFFKKASKYQKLIHALKYKNNPEVGVIMGKHFGIDLFKDNDFKGVDYIIPVPLHYKKKISRGYNQSEMIAIGLAEIMPAIVRTDILYRKVFTQTQTKKSRFDRWENVEQVFGVNKMADLQNKHILLVDDVLTTGATIESCAKVLIEVSNVRVSIAVLAYAEKG